MNEIFLIVVNKKSVKKNISTKIFPPFKMSRFRTVVEFCYQFIIWICGNYTSSRLLLRNEHNYEINAIRFVIDFNAIVIASTHHFIQFDDIIVARHTELYGIDWYSALQQKLTHTHIRRHCSLFTLCSVKIKFYSANFWFRYNLDCDLMITYKAHGKLEGKIATNMRLDGSRPKTHTHTHTHLVRLEWYTVQIVIISK